MGVLTFCTQVKIIIIIIIIIFKCIAILFSDSIYSSKILSIYEHKYDINAPQKEFKTKENSY